MTLVLDSGGLSGLVQHRGHLAELRARGLWPAQVPAVVLTEALTGNHQRDFHANRLLRACQVRVVDELLAREGARLRAATGRAGSISATDAVVAAYAASQHDPVILTSDPTDMNALSEHTTQPVEVRAI